nr:GAF domain-containing protein [Pseudonocardia bannensis]
MRPGPSTTRSANATALDTATPRFLDNEFGSADVNTFASLASAATHVASLDEATHLHRASSARYRDIMRPLGLGDELRAALVTGSECWGYLCLHRADRPLGFTPPEAALIARLGPHIAHALRQAVLLHNRGGAGGDGSDQRPGVVLLADDLSVVAITPEAEHLLSLVEDVRSTRLPLPVAVYTVAVALGAVERGTAAPRVLPSTRVRTVVGRWLRVHASRLRGPPGEDRIAVVVEPAVAGDTVPLVLSAHGLSPRGGDRQAGPARFVDPDHLGHPAHLPAHRSGPPQSGLRQGRRAQPPRSRRPAPRPGRVRSALT